MSAKHAASLAVCAALALGVAACGASAPTPASASAPPPAASRLEAPPRTGDATLAVWQDNLILIDPVLTGPREARWDFAGTVRVVSARFTLDGEVVSARTMLDPRTKDPTLDTERATLVLATRLAPGPHELAAEIQTTLPQCCYAGCFPKRIRTFRDARTIVAEPGSSRVVRYRVGAPIGLGRVTTPIEERWEITVSEQVEPTGP